MNINDLATIQTAPLTLRNAGITVTTDTTALNGPALLQNTPENEPQKRTETRTAADNRRDVVVITAVPDRNALYDVADIRRSGGGRILPSYQVVRKTTLEGNQIVDKVVDVVLATERKSLRIYRRTGNRSVRRLPSDGMSGD